MGILDFGADRWLAALGMTADTVPDVLVLEGTWWHRKAVAQRLSHLTDVAETPFPDIYLGRHGKTRVAYCCAYGAARAAEPTHVFAQIGTPLVVQIGTCGALTDRLKTGQVAVPQVVAARDGVGASYGGSGMVTLDRNWSLGACTALRASGVDAIETRHLTGTTLFAQSDAVCAGWAAEGFETVDMETATVAIIARRFGAAAVAMLAVWDPLARGETFLDPLPQPAADALADASKATWIAALDLGRQIAARRGESRAKEETALS
jgi:uridine phosphorylase